MRSVGIHGREGLPPRRGARLSGEPELPKMHGRVLDCRSPGPGESDELLVGRGRAGGRDRDDAAISRGRQMPPESRGDHTIALLRKIHYHIMPSCIPPESAWAARRMISHSLRPLCKVRVQRAVVRDDHPRRRRASCRDGVVQLRQDGLLQGEADDLVGEEKRRRRRSDERGGKLYARGRKRQRRWEPCKPLAGKPGRQPGR